MKAVRTGALEQARNLLERTLPWGYQPHIIGPLYAVVLCELGDVELARQIVRDIKQWAEARPENCQDRAVALAMLRQCRTHLPDGPLSANKRDLLKQDANRWRPQLGEESV